MSIVEVGVSSDNLKESVYQSRIGDKVTLLSERAYNDEEMEYLVNPNIYDNVFTPWEFYKPELNVPFFYAKIDIGGSACGREYTLDIIPRVNRAVIVQDDEIKKYTLEFITPIVDDKISDGCTRFGDFHQISKSRLMPDENITCNCGHYNSKPIDAFPWDKFPERYIIGSTFNSLNNNINILMKRMWVYDLFDMVSKNLTERKTKIEELQAKS